MKRTVIAVVLAAAALALLASLVLQSQSVPVTMHVAQNAVSTELARVDEEYGTLLSTLSVAWDNVQAPGEGARALNERLAGSSERLAGPLAQLQGGGAQQNRIRDAYRRFTETSTRVATLADELVVEQAAYVESVAFLRESGARIVQQMRDIRLDTSAADAFQLVVGTLDYAGPAASVQSEELRRLIVMLRRDQRLDANMPREVDRLTTAADTILRSKPLIEGKLNQLAATPLRSSATNLSLAAESLYASQVSATDQARVMLSVYAVLLLVAGSFVGLRLQQSYRDLNRANTELEGLNQSLEERVAERTQALAGTLHELKESQVQLVQAEKMSSLGQLVAGISHEINTPLLYLANNAVLIQERLEVAREFAERCAETFDVKAENFGSRAEYQAKFVEALRGLKRMLREQEVQATLQEAEDLARDSIEGLGELTEMAQSLKDFSRLDRAPVGSFDVNAGVEKTLLIVRNIIKHKAEVRKSFGELPEIQCSPSQINQVFLNLVTNAAQAIEGTGEIIITTKLYDPDHVAVTVADNGCGIAPEHLDKIRDPFFTTKEVGTGTGLGLSIVDEIIRSHHGELKVESTLGEGSAFTVILPIRQAQAEEALAEEDLDETGVDRALADELEPLAEAI